MRIHRNRKITAADDEMSNDDFDNRFDDRPMTNRFMDDDEDIDNTLDNIADNIEDIQDQMDDIDPDDVDIEVDNNINGHYIAECERCHGIFISAMLESDQDIEKISGTCPLCEKETDQYLKWIVKSVSAM